MNPTLRAKITETLKENLLDYTPRLRVVAKYIVDHPRDFGLDSIRESSRKAGVSTFTMVRMARQLGFESYEELRAPYRQDLLATISPQDRPTWLGNVTASGELGETQATVAANLMAVVERSLQQQKPQQMERVVDLLLGAKRVFLTATRATYSFAYYFHYIGRMPLKTLVLVPRHMNSPIDELNAAEPGDVLVAITVYPYSRETVEACFFAQSRGVRIVLISDSDVVIPSLKPAEILVASTISTHHFGSFVGILAVIETLIAILVKRGGADALEQINSYERLRDKIDAYWQAPKKH